MSNPPYVRAALAQVALGSIPPLIRRSLLDQSTFREEYGLATKDVIVFGDHDFAIQRSELLKAVRTVLAGTPDTEIADVDGRSLQLQNQYERGQPRLILVLGDQRYLLPDFAVLSKDQDMRLRSLDEAAQDVNLPTSAQLAWKNILAKRGLEDNEIESFHGDLRDTPVHVERSIRREFEVGRSSISSLVPASRRYFERLVGIYEESATISHYAAVAGHQFMQQLSRWRPYEGFLFNLFLSAHSALTVEIDVSGLDNDSLIRAYDFIENNDDILSQIGAIEVGFRILRERSEVRPYIVRLIRCLRDDDVSGSTSKFKLLEALFVLVDGELSRTRVLSRDPPFYRRLASFAHAALIHRQLVQCGVDYDGFSKWAFTNRSEQFYIQSLADLRTEPRWIPDLATASQIKADFFGRIMIAARNFEKDIGAGELQDLVLGHGPGSLQSLSEFPFPYFPGPLEGAEDSQNDLPDDLAQFIETNLETDEVGPSSFIALVNSAMVFRVDSGQAELAAKALRLANYRLTNVQDQSQLLGILNGLAIVAAVTRSSALADELRILVRRYRHDSQFGFSSDEAMRICLVASASRQERFEWRDFAGEWLTEFAFDELESDEAKVLQSCLQSLLHIVPELWISCAKAEAALKAYCSR